MTEVEMIGKKGLNGGMWLNRTRANISLIANEFACTILTWDQQSSAQGAVSIKKTVLPGMAIPMLKIRRPNGRLIFNMEITICR